MRNLLNEKIDADGLLIVPISLKYKKDIFREFTKEVTVFMYPEPAKDIKKPKIL
jgi:hypothetical protein